MVHIFQKSAGGIVYKKEKGIIKILLLEWLNAKKQKIFVLPKGKVEAKEDIQSTAIREISEETGLETEFLDIVKFLKKVNFSFVAFYQEDAPMIAKDVYLFLVEYTGKSNPKPRKKERFTGYRWFTLDELKDIKSKPEQIYEIVQQNIVYM